MLNVIMVNVIMMIVAVPELYLVEAKGEGG
jgi:hypothetical protein